MRRISFVVPVLVLGMGLLQAQRFSDGDARRGMERIDEAEGARRLQAFRQQGLVGDYVFEFQLEHKPRKAPTVRYEGVMWGRWNDRGALSRFKIFANRERDAAVELILQNGYEPEAWIRRDPGETFKLIQGQALFEPILPELTYSVFDLQMPFIYWDAFEYEGPSLVGASRIGQGFVMLPPEGSASQAQGISGVRVLLDDTYNALWRVEVLNGDGSLRSRFSVESIKKVQEQYIVKRITHTEYPSKNSTTFNVLDASVGIELEPDFFKRPSQEVIGPTADGLK